MLIQNSYVRFEIVPGALLAKSSDGTIKAQFPCQECAYTVKDETSKIQTKERVYNFVWNEQEKFWVVTSICPVEIMHYNADSYCGASVILIARENGKNICQTKIKHALYGYVLLENGLAVSDFNQFKLVLDLTNRKDDTV